MALNPDPKPRRLRWPLLPVLDRMVSLELAKTLATILIVLVTIIVSRKFLGILTKAIEGEVATDTVFSLLGLKTLTALAILLPPSLFMAVLTVMGRMYRDHEMSVLASAGVGPRRLYRSIGWVVGPVFVLSAYLALVVMPWSERHIQQRRDPRRARHQARAFQRVQRR
jgi:lipopolysaccharide export system permease protein